MAILKIARMGHPVLARRAAPVADPTDPDVHRLIGDMLETLEDISGLGLAAPQIHVSKRVVIFHVPAVRAEAAPGENDPVEMTVLINPEIEAIGDDVRHGWEGCLSVPGLRGLVPRHHSIRYRGVAPSGAEIERQAEGMHARVVQHECDHLDGILYPQRMTDMRWLVFNSELKYALAELSASPDEETVARVAGRA